MTAFLLLIAFLFGFGFIVGLTRSSTLGVIAFILISVIIIGNWIALGFFQAVGAFLCTVIPFLIGMGLTDYDRPNSGSGSSSSKRSSSSSDIPDYWNWDTIYRTKTTYYDEGEVTMEKAIAQFQLDYEKTKRAFNEEEKLRAVSDYDKDYIEGFFKDFASVVDTNLTTLEVLGDGKYSLVQQAGSTTRTYTHWPRRRYSIYDMVMWRGEIKEGKNCHIRYGLSNEHNQQYWTTECHNNRSGFTPLLGEAECVWK